MHEINEGRQEAGMAEWKPSGGFKLRDKKEMYRQGHVAWEESKDAVQMQLNLEKDVEKQRKWIL